MATRIDLPKGTKVAEILVLSWGWKFQKIPSGKKNLSWQPLPDMSCWGSLEVKYFFTGGRVKRLKFKDHPDFGWIKAMVFD